MDSPHVARAGRSIPARAGEPTFAATPGYRGWVYPRACGGTTGEAADHQPIQGLSPRVRGNLVANEGFLTGDGSIPARAGEPLAKQPTTNLFKVYPRACGGTLLTPGISPMVLGLSPRVRGNQPQGVETVLRCRSIPARAGEPHTRPASAPSPSVYPRACGGTIASISSLAGVTGLSPRVRGNLRCYRRRRRNRGSIPARAGEPYQQRPVSFAVRVYPRACGGTAAASFPAAPGHRRRSIPARAGEPTQVHASYEPYRVYPRACGGTFGIQGIDPLDTGLSPRVRGNRVHCAMSLYPIGSIPARAGEPVAGYDQPGLPGVYPRACGGTGMMLELAEMASGLSPRVRGNLSGQPGYDSGRGSIPARAGEPLAKQLDITNLFKGSIPARAGEPRSAPRGTAPGRVYPRACGGTRGTAPGRCRS